MEYDHRGIPSTSIFYQPPKIKTHINPDKDRSLPGKKRRKARRLNNKK